jgi:hypothetical protein
MYGAGVYHYRQPIRSLPQLPTANYRLKPPGLSGCAACGGLGQSESGISPGWVVLGAVFGFVMFKVFFNKEKGWTRYRDGYRSKINVDLMVRDLHIVWPDKQVKVVREKNGTWTIWTR